MAKILVVDDSVFARLNICTMLRQAGHETLEAGNGLEGLQLVAAQRPDCILSDLLMPEMDGIGFLTALREQQTDLPAIVLSADIQETKRQQCLALGAAGFLSKPPNKLELLGLLDQVLTPGVAP
jgi:CheY-like chemotaxis protein